MSFFPPITLNLKQSQILVNTNTNITTVGTAVSLTSLSGSSNKVSLASNTITLKSGADYYIFTNIGFNTNALVNFESSKSTLFRFGFYNTGNSTWLTQKTTNPSNHSSSSAVGLRNYQAFCVIPSPASGMTIQLRIKSLVSTTYKANISRANADANIGDSLITIYHNN